MTETKVTGKKYRICTDATNDKWDRVSFWTKASDVELDDGTTVQNKITSLTSEMTSLGESVADGKASVASAITAKGVTTASDASFATMASNIGSISAGSGAMTITQKNSYSYSGGNYANSDIIIKNEGWKTLYATPDSYVQYASVYNNDTEERVVLHLTDKLDISNISNLRLRLQSINSVDTTATVIWKLE